MIAHMSPFGVIYVVQGSTVVKLTGLKRSEFLQKLTELRVSAPSELMKNPTGVPTKLKTKRKTKSPISPRVGKRPSKTTKQPDGTVKAGWIVRNGKWVKNI